MGPKRDVFRIALVAMVLAAACRATPIVDGLPLICDHDCPDGLRCIDGTCMDNSPPELKALGAQSVTVGFPFSVTAIAEDPDGDAVAITWSQVEGPASVLAEPRVGAELSLSFPVVGLFVFDLIADDTFATTVLRLAVTVVNEVPVIDPIPDTVALLGETVELTAAVADADGHSTTSTWTQLLGPEVLAEPLTAPSLSFTTASYGLHIFEVVADDGYASSEPVTVRVIAQPFLDVVFVSASAIGPVEDCGAFDSPCPTIGAATAVMAATDVSTMLVAASDGPYQACLALDNGARLYGAYDPLTWEPDSSLRVATRIECDGAGGVTSHRIDGDGTEVRDVVLAWAAEVDPDPALIFAAGTENERQIVTTLLINQGQPLVAGIDVLAAACGEGCKTMAVASIDASPVLEDLEVYSSLSGFDSVEDFYGIYTLGGAPILRSSKDGPRAVGDGERGGVILNAPVDQIASGITAGRSEITIEGMVVNGGLASFLAGINLFGSDATLTGSALELMSFGSQALAGILVTDCESDTWPCACPSSGAVCAEPALPPTHFEPAVTIADNTVLLQGAVASSGMLPCLGVPLGFKSGAGGLVLTGNHLEILGAFNLATGIKVEMDEGLLPSPSLPVRIADNTVALADGWVSHLCASMTTPVDGLKSGNIGLVATGGRGVTVTGNEIVVGTHEATARGLTVTSGQEVLIEQNLIVVGQRDDILTERAVGVRLGVSVFDETGDQRSRFERNRVRLGYGIMNGTAAELVDTSPWLIRNNFFNPGAALYGTALQLGRAGADGVWPKLYHNTFHAGWGLTGRAIRMLADDTQDVTVPGAANNGMLMHNLIDGGEPTGQRFLIDNDGRQELESLSANFGQFVGTIAGPSPSFILAPPSRDLVPQPGGDSEVGDTTFAPTWTAVLAGSGEVVKVGTSSSNQIKREATYSSFGAAVATWAGLDGGISALVMVTELPAAEEGTSLRLLAVASLKGGSLAGVTGYAPWGEGAGWLEPKRAVVADWDGVYPFDLFFSATRDNEDYLFVMRGSLNGGYRPAVSVAEYTNLLFLDVDRGGAGLFIIADHDDEPAVFTLSHSDGGAETGPILLSSFLTYDPAADAIEGFSVVDIIEEGTNSRARDFIFVVNGAIHVAVRSAPGGTPVETPMPSGVCLGSLTVGYATGDLVDDDPDGSTFSAENEVLVACGDGRLQIIQWIRETITGPASFVIVKDTIVDVTDSPITALAVGPMEEDRTEILIGHAGAHHSLELVTTNHGARAFTSSALPITLPLLADVVHRDSQERPSATWIGDPAEMTVRTDSPSDPPPCGLVARSGVDPDDLHLFGGATNPCARDGVNVGDTSGDPELDGFDSDIDGPGSRVDGILDIGADEI